MFLKQIISPAFPPDLFHFASERKKNIFMRSRSDFLFCVMSLRCEFAREQRTYIYLLHTLHLRMISTFFLAQRHKISLAKHFVVFQKQKYSPEALWDKHASPHLLHRECIEMELRTQFVRTEVLS